MKKIMSLRDIVFMNVTAILGLRWLPIAAGYGASSTILWVFAAILFFIPMGLVACELATAWPEQGGLYVWTKRAYGEKPAFLVSWFYWINSFFFVPGALTFIAVTLAYAFNPALATSKIFVTSVLITLLWLAILLNITSMHLVKWLSNLSGSLGVMLPGIVIIALGFGMVYFWHHPVATDYSLAKWWPDLGAKSNIAFLSTLMFAMAGIELTPILAGETKDPHKTYPRATWITALIIVATYVIGTMAISFLLAPEKVTASSGIMEAIHLAAANINMGFLVPILAILMAIGMFGGVSVWIIVPLKMFLESAKSVGLPDSFTRLNKNYMPQNALVIQGIAITLIILSTAFSSSVNVFYETLVLMASITYFIPYLYLFLNFIKLRKLYPKHPRPYRVPGGRITAWFVAVPGLVSIIIAIVLPFIMPPRDLITARDILLYRAEIGGGIILFLAIGYFIYVRYKK